MASGKVLLFPHPILREKAGRVRVFDARLGRIFKRLEETMETQPLGIGIAAPQIGIKLRAAVVDVSARVSGAKRLHLANPDMLERAHPYIGREGCMSLPEYTANVKRYRWIRILYQDAEGNCHELVSEGIEAVCIQHEIDHLNGILFLDHVASLKTDMIPRDRMRRLS